MSTSEGAVCREKQRNHLNHLQCRLHVLPARYTTVRNNLKTCLTGRIFVWLIRPRDNDIHKNEHLSRVDVING